MIENLVRKYALDLVFIRPERDSRQAVLLFSTQQRGFPIMLNYWLKFNFRLKLDNPSRFTMSSFKCGMAGQ
jgi:hypothetical protein